MKEQTINATSETHLERDCSLPLTISVVNVAHRIHQVTQYRQLMHAQTRAYIREIAVTIVYISLLLILLWLVSTIPKSASPVCSAFRIGYRPVVNRQVSRGRRRIGAGTVWAVWALAHTDLWPRGQPIYLAHTEFSTRWTWDPSRCLWFSAMRLNV